MSQEPPPIPQEQPPQPQRLEDDAGMRMILPVGRSGWAIASGYLGLCSVLIIPAPFAIVTGIIGIINIKKSQNSESPKRGLGRCIFGLVMGVIFAALGVLIVISSRI